jgi:nucleoredoxin
MSFDASNLFPGVSTLLKNGSDDVPITNLSSAEVIGIYFSAHWCGPCRGFTPVLSKAYEDLKATGKRFEIVFLSADRDEASMRSYYATMPWLCLHWQDLKRIEEELNEKYECQGIPHLVLIDAATGNVITTDGRAAIMLGPAAFPFTPAAAAAAKKAKGRKALDLFDSGRSLGLEPDTLTSEAVVIFIGNSENNARHVVEPLCQATTALGSRVKVVCIPFTVPDADGQLIFAAKFHPDWHILPNADALAAAIFTAVDEDPEEALLLVVNSSFTEVIQTDALRAVYRHKDRGFPWSDEAIAQAVEEQKRKVAALAQTLQQPGLQFLNGADIVTRPGASSHSLDELRAMDCVGLYFSAHWCPPCRRFTPQLARVYQQLVDDGKKFGVVFVSSDKSTAEFQEYFDAMPWVALAFHQRELKGLLSEAFEVQGIPTLVLIDPKTGAFNVEGADVISQHQSAGFPWGPEQLSAAAAAAAAVAAAHDAELEQRWRDAGKVALKQHRGRGSCDFNHRMEFNNFNTFVADVKLSNGRFYYEVELLSLKGVAQFGVCTDGFAARADPGGEGVGDDEHSYAVDGVRQRTWPADDGVNFTGSQWSDGQVIGFAVDMSDERSARVSVSVDGSFAPPNGLAFDRISATWLSPAFSASAGECRVNFGDTPFKHSPPDTSFVSVQSFAKDL